MGPVLLKRLSDERLAGCLAKGEAAAFDELYRRYSHRLAAYAGNLVDDPAAGDDVAQTALLKAYQALRAGKVPGAVRPWLYRIAHNAAIDLTLRRRDLLSDDLSESAELPGSTAERPFSAPLLAAIGALTDHQRRVYVLRELHGLRMDETARELGLSTTQVEQALFAARNRLAEHLVFGERLGCPSVRRLATGPLDTHERRAIKAHLRACRDCRSSLGGRGTVLKWLPVLPLDWLRSLLTLGGGAPAAAKLGAVVAATTLAVGVPVAVRTHDLQLTTRAHHTAERPTARISPAPDPAARLVIEPVRLTQPVLARAPTPTARLAGHRESEANGGRSRDDGERATTGREKQSDGGTDGAPARAVTVEGSSGHSDGGSDGGDSGNSGGGGSNDGGSNDGGSNDGGSSQGGD